MENGCLWKILVNYCIFLVAYIFFYLSIICIIEQTAAIVQHMHVLKELKDIWIICSI